MIDIANIKHPQAFTIVAFALVLIVPLPAYLLFFDIELLNRLEFAKLILISAAVSGLNTFALLPFAITLTPKGSPIAFIVSLLTCVSFSHLWFFVISASIYLINKVTVWDAEMPFVNILVYVGTYLIALIFLGFYYRGSTESD